jgi:hypothetical protein
MIPKILVALLYFGKFSGGELELGSPFSKTISLQNFDLILLNSSKVYHHSHPFQENRVNLIFYCNIIKNEQLLAEPELV